MRPVALLVALALAACASAQDPGAPLAFDVASIKPSAEHPNSVIVGILGGPGTSDPGRILISRYSLAGLVGSAYQQPFSQIVGTEPLSQTQFDIVATLPRGTTRDQIAPMLRTLLAERFQLVVHHEQREMNAHRLTVAKNGPKLMPLQEPEVPQRYAELDLLRNLPAAKPNQADKDGYPIPAPGQSFAQANGKSTWVGRQQSMARLTEMFGSYLHTIIVDKTGLTGPFDYTLHFVNRDNDLSGPNLIEAVTQQLGLKLEPARELVDVLVIDKATKLPTEN